MSKIYAKPGGFLQHIMDERDSSMPEHYVLMSEHRPGLDYICRNNFDGTGEWVRRKEIQSCREFLKKWVSGFFRFFDNVYRMFVWQVRLLHFSWLAFNKGFPLIRSTSFISNLATSFDYRKGVDLLCFAIPLLIIKIFNLSEGAAYDLLLATAAAAIFDSVITLVPREQSKLANAQHITRALYPLVMMKNHQYSMIGYLGDPRYSEEPLTDQGMTREKAKALVLLMDRTFEEKNDGGGPILEFDFNNCSTIRDYYFRAHTHLLSQVAKLREVAKPELFPVFCKTLESMHDSLAQGWMLRTGILEFPEYVTMHFKFIETLELNFLAECQRYSGPLGGQFDPQMKFNRESIMDVINVYPIWYYADPRKYT